MSGRRSLLWVVIDAKKARRAAFFEAKDDGTILVSVSGGGEPDVDRTFRSAAQAMEWALDLHQRLIAEGWTES